MTNVPIVPSAGLRRALWPLLVVALTAGIHPAFSQSGAVIAQLKDFRAVEVRGAGFTLPKETTVHIEGLGGGEKSFWERWFDEDESPSLFAGGWIINAETRQPVWEMTFENTAGAPDRRHCSDDVKLPKGSYELYYAAHGYERHTMFSNSSVNIDRRTHPKRSQRSYGIVLGDDNYDRLVERFMDKAEEYGITLSVPAGDAAAVAKFDAPAPVPHAVLEAVRLGDRALVHKTLAVAKDVTLHVQAIGEGQPKDDLVDHGWITRADTRERVWEMSPRKGRRAGGAAKNRRFEDDVTLAKGVYELMYVTDDSHSNDDWNARPPYDPFRYGIILSAGSEADRASVAVRDFTPSAEHRIVSLTKVGNSDLVSAGFSLKTEAKLHVLGVGEWGSGDDPADYGWIVDARTRKRVWSMADHATRHAGGASKNRMTDEVITLPKGDYLAYYQTDGSHAYGDWNADPPYEPESWGLTVSGEGEKFDPRSVTVFEEGAEQGVIAQIIRAKDGAHKSKRFTVAAPTKVRVYAIGEGQDREMYDYGWIEDAADGRTVWEMTYGMTSRAGGARKNRMVDAVITLEKGEYVLHYETDGSHAFNDWNDDPPEDPSHWGISLYQEQK
jgi:hypothetical protein